MRNIVIALVGIYVIAMLGLTLMQRRIIFPRHFTTPFPDAGDGIPGLVKLWIDTPEGKVEGWFLPGNDTGPDEPGPLVIFAHGNAELIEYWPEMLAGYRRMGVNLLLPEYRGYGRSAGSPSQEAITADFIAFYDMVARRPGVDSDRIVFHGRSIGGGAVCALARERKPAAMILQSTFTSIKAMAGRFMLPGFLVADPFDNLSTVEELDVPLLIIHGRHDDLIPYSHGEKLHAAARQSRFVTYDCDHNSCPPDWDIFWDDVKGWLTETGMLQDDPR